MKYTTSKWIEKENIEIVVNIRLDDECKNGHNDFSITGTVYNVIGKPRRRGRELSGGCIHEEIEKYFPEFKTFVDLHLNDEYGIPMHCYANLNYHLEKTDKERVMKRYHLTDKQYEDLLLQVDNKERVINYLRQSGIIQNRNDMAKKAIKQLEDLTGDTYTYANKESTHLKN